MFEFAGEVLNGEAGVNRPNERHFLCSWLARSWIAGLTVFTGSHVAIPLVLVLGADMSGQLVLAVIFVVANARAHRALVGLFFSVAALVVIAVPDGSEIPITPWVTTFIRTHSSVNSQVDLQVASLVEYPPALGTGETPHSPAARFSV
jgi:hypothetical protein